MPYVGEGSSSVEVTISYVGDGNSQVEYTICNTGDNEHFFTGTKTLRNMEPSFWPVKIVFSDTGTLSYSIRNTSAYIVSSVQTCKQSQMIFLCFFAQVNSNGVPGGNGVAALVKYHVSLGPAQGHVTALGTQIAAQVMLWKQNHAVSRVVTKVSLLLSLLLFVDPPYIKIIQFFMFLHKTVFVGFRNEATSTSIYNVCFNGELSK